MQSRPWALVFLVVALAATCLADGFQLPPLAGRFSGELSPFGAAQPSIHWTATATLSEGGSRDIAVAFDGPGANVGLEMEIATGNGRGTWRIPSAKIDLKTWFAVLAGKYFPRLSALSATGDLTASGQGAFDASGLSGQLHLEVANASLSDAKNGWSVHDLSTKVVFPKLPERETLPRQQLKLGSLNLGNMATGAAEATFQVESNNQIRLHSAKVQAFGGTIVVSGFVLDPEKPAMETVLRIEGVELAALQPYLPKTVPEAHGKVDGQLVLRWSGANGIQISDGHLRLRPGTPASLRIATAPGFLSSRVPERTPVPKWVSWVAPDASTAFKPARDTLQSIESGKELLVVESIQAELHGDAEGSDPTAVVKLVAHPTQRDAVKTVRLNFRAFGPLADVIRYGLKGNVSLGTE